MIILGISCLYHDSAAALCVDGEIIAAAQEERFTRVKHDNRVPIHAVRYCLKESKLSITEVDRVVYYDNPILTLDRFMHNLRAVDENDKMDMIVKSGEDIFARRLWISELLRRQIGPLGKADRLLVCEHHISHAASAFYPSPFDEAAIITTDGVGEWATTTIGIGEGNHIKLLKEMQYPHSLGLLYSAFTYFCGFKVNSGDYKFMGLAPYGEPVYCDLIKEKVIDIKEDGSYRLNLELFDFYRGRAMTNERFAKLFGGPRREPESNISKREMDIAASAQKVTEEILVLLAKEAAGITGSKNLCMAGGVALNCVANGKILKENIFDNIWIQPAAGDAGGALGCALFAEYQYYNKPRTVGRTTQKGSYLGPDFSNQYIADFLDKNHYSYVKYEDEEKLYKIIAELLEKKNVIGLFHGRMEYGPRALGNRSIIADPRSDEMQSKLNLKIKFRESFRPFAPSVLEEKEEEYFELDVPSPYMLLVANVKKERCLGFNAKEFLDQNDYNMLPVVNAKRSDIPAVTHVDYSARIQTVNMGDNPYYYNIIKEFSKISGCDCIVNTSFNVRGEPIVCTPEDAYRCFMRTEMDILVLENCVLYKSEQPEYKEEKDWREEYELD